MPQAIDERRKFLSDMVRSIFNKIVPNFAADILFVYFGKKNTRNIPLAEVKMKNRKVALAIRRQFTVKRRTGGDFGRLWIANSVTLATRVRIDILKAMVKH
jgi:hypothetical protein